jgi:hypothetical protein
MKKSKGFIIIAVLALMAFASSSVFAAPAETDQRHDNMPAEQKHSSHQPNQDQQNKDAVKETDKNKDGQQAGMSCMKKEGGMHSAMKDKMAAHQQPAKGDANAKDGQQADMGCMNKEGGMHSAMKDKMAGHAKAADGAGDQSCGEKPKDK